MQLFTYSLQIIERHLDVFGHVNNSVYLELFEEARWAFITERGYGLDKVQSLQEGPVILRAELDFKRELTNREWVQITVEKPVPINSKMFTLKQQILKEGGILSSAATFVIGFFSLKDRKLIPASSLWSEVNYLSLEA